MSIYGLDKTYTFIKIQNRWIVGAAEANFFVVVLLLKIEQFRPLILYFYLFHFKQLSD